MRCPAAIRRKKRPPNNGLNLKSISTSENVREVIEKEMNRKKARDGRSKE